MKQRNWGNYFKKVIKEYGGLGNLCRDSWIFQEPLFREINSLIKPGDSVCELGIGYGVAMAVQLAGKGYKVTGIDNDKTSIKMGKEVCKSLGCKIKFWEADARACGLPISDLVYSIGLIEHFENEKERIAIISSHASNCKKWVLIVVPTKHAKSSERDWMPYTKKQLINECIKAELKPHHTFVYGMPKPWLEDLPLKLRTWFMNKFTYGCNLGIVCEVEQR